MKIIVHQNLFIGFILVFLLLGFTIPALSQTPQTLPEERIIRVKPDKENRFKPGSYIGVPKESVGKFGKNNEDEIDQIPQPAPKTENDNVEKTESTNNMAWWENIKEKLGIFRQWIGIGIKWLFIFILAAGIAFGIIYAGVYGFIQLFKHRQPVREITAKVVKKTIKGVGISIKRIVFSPYYFLKYAIYRPLRWLLCLLWKLFCLLWRNKKRIARGVCIGLSYFLLSLLYYPLNYAVYLPLRWLLSSLRRNEKHIKKAAFVSMKHTALSPYYFGKYAIYFPVKLLIRFAVFIVKQIIKHGVVMETVGTFIIISGLAVLSVYMIIDYRKSDMASYESCLKLTQDVYPRVMWIIFAVISLLILCFLIRYILRKIKELPSSGLALFLIITLAFITGIMNYIINNHFSKESSDIRSQAIEQLAENNWLDQNAINKIIHKMNDKEESIRIAVAKAMGYSDDQRATGLLIKALGGGDSMTVRRVIADSLSRLGVIRTTEDFELLMKISRSSQSVESEVIDAFVRIGEPSIQYMIDLLTGDKDTNLAYTTLARIAEIYPQKVLEAIDPAIPCMDDNVAIKAIDIIKKIDMPGRANALMRVARNASWVVREAAIEALSEYEINSQEAYIMRLINGCNERELVNIGTPAVSFLISALYGPTNTYKNADGIEIGRHDFAAKVLGRIKDKRALEPIVEAMKNRSINPRTAIEALASIRDNRAIEPLLYLLHSYSSEYLNEYIINAIVRISPLETHPAVLKELKKGSLVAARVIEQTGGSEVIDLLIDRLYKDENEEVINTIIRALGKLRAEKAGKHLVKILKKGNIDSEKIKVTNNEGRTLKMDKLIVEDAIINIGGSTVRHLLGTINDKEAGDIAQEIILKIGSEAVPTLVERLNHWNPNKRKQAVELLAKIGEPAIPSLIRAFGSDAYSVREESLNALLKIGGSEKSVNLLIEAIDDPNQDMRWRVAMALASLPDCKALKPLITLLHDPSSKVRKAAAIALGFYGDCESEKALKPLIELLDDSDNFVRKAAVVSLGMLASHPRLQSHQKLISDAIMGKLNDQDWKVRSTATQALRNFEYSKEIVNSLLKFLADPNPYIRRQAVSALGKFYLSHSDYSVREQLSQIISNHRENEYVRATAIQVIEGTDLQALMHKGKSGIKSLIIGLESPDSSISQVSYEALVKIGKPSCDELIQNLCTDDLLVRQKIADILIMIGEPAKRPLRKAIWNKDNTELSGLAKAVLWNIDYIAAQKEHQNLYFRYVTWPEIKKWSLISIPFYLATLILTGGLIGLYKYIRERKMKTKMTSLITRLVNPGQHPIILAEATIHIDKIGTSVTIDMNLGNEGVISSKKQTLEKALSDLVIMGNREAIQKITKIRIVDGNQRLMHLDRASYELTIDIEAFGSYYLLLMEVEHELQHVIFNKNINPFIEETTVLYQELKRFLSFTPGQKEEVINTLKSNLKIDAKNFVDLLQKAMNEGLEKVFDEIVRYTKGYLSSPFGGVSKQDVILLCEEIRSKKISNRLYEGYSIEPHIAKLMLTLHRKMVNDSKKKLIGENRYRPYQFTLRELYKWADIIQRYRDKWGITKAFIKGACYIYGDQMESEEDQKRFCLNLKELDIDILASMTNKDNLEDILTEKPAFTKDKNDEWVKIGNIKLDVNKNPDAKYIPEEESSKLILIERTIIDLEALAMAVELDDPVLLMGISGVGKTSIIRYLASITRNSLRRFNLNGQTDKMDFIGGFRPSKPSNVNEGFRFEWSNGILIESMEQGHWLVLDELNLAEPEIIERIRYLLEPKKHLRVSEHQGELWISGEEYDKQVAEYIKNHSNKKGSLVDEAKQHLREKGIFRIHPNFRLFATMNPPDYEGRKELSPALMNKFRVKWLRDFTREEIHKILKDKFALSDDITGKIFDFHQKLSEMAGKNGELGREIGQCYVFDIRHLFRFAKRIQNWVDEKNSSLGTIEQRLVMEAQEVYGEILRSDRDREFFDEFIEQVFSQRIVAVNTEIKIDEAQGKVFFGDIDLPINKSGGLLIPTATAELAPIPTTLRQLRSIAHSIKMGDNLILVGPTSSAKTSILRYIAFLTHNNFLRLNLDSQLDIGDLIGRFIPEEFGKGFRWQDGDLVKAMGEGYWVLMDEFNLAGADVLERINPLLDDDASIVITEHEGEVWLPANIYDAKKESGADMTNMRRIHENFRLFAAMNPESYVGRTRLSLAMRSKLVEKWFSGELSSDEINEIAKFCLTKKNLYTGEPIPDESVNQVAKLMSSIHSMVLDMVKENKFSPFSLTGNAQEYQFSLRELKDWAGFIRDLVNVIGKSVLELRIKEYDDRIRTISLESREKPINQKSIREELKQDLETTRLSRENAKQALGDPTEIWRWGINRAIFDGSLYIYCDKLQGLITQRTEEDTGDKDIFYKDILLPIFTHEAQREIGGYEIIDVEKERELLRESMGQTELIKPSDMKIAPESAKLVDEFDSLTSGLPEELRPHLNKIRSFLVNPQKQIDGIHGFALLPNEIAIPLVELALQHPNPIVKKAAMEVLSKLKLSQGEYTPLISDLEQFLNDADKSLRITAALVLEQLEWFKWRKEAIPRLNESSRRPERLSWIETLRRLVNLGDGAGDYLGILRFLHNPLTQIVMCLISFAVMILITPFLLQHLSYSIPVAVITLLGYGGIAKSLFQFEKRTLQKFIITTSSMFSLLIVLTFWGTYTDNRAIIALAYVSIMLGTWGLIRGMLELISLSYYVIYLPQLLILSRRYRRIALDLDDFYTLMEEIENEEFVHFPFKSEEKVSYLTTWYGIVTHVSGFIIGAWFAISAFHGAKVDSLPVILIIGWLPVWCQTIIGSLAGGGIGYFMSSYTILSATAIREMVYKPLKAIFVDEVLKKNVRYAFKDILSGYDPSIIDTFRRYRNKLIERGKDVDKIKKAVAGENPADKLRPNAIGKTDSGVYIDTVYLPFPKNFKSDTGYSDDTHVFVPESENSELIPTISTIKNMKKIALSIILDNFTLLIGETGVGKTSMVRFVAYLSRHNFRRFNLNGQSDKIEFVGGYKPDPTGVFRWKDGILVDAMLHGHWLVLDELNLCESHVLERLNSLLDDDRTLVLAEHQGEHFVPNKLYERKRQEGAKVEFDEERKSQYIIDSEGRRIYPIHFGFRLFATMNPAEYAGRKVLSPAMMNRFKVKWIDDITAVEKKAILIEKYPKKTIFPYERKHFIFGDRVLDFMDIFHERISTSARLRHIGGDIPDPYYYSIRDLLRVFDRAVSRIQLIENNNAALDIYERQDILNQEILDVYTSRIRDEDEAEVLKSQIDVVFGHSKSDEKMEFSKTDSKVSFGEIRIPLNGKTGPYIPSAESILTHIPSTLLYLKKLAKSIFMKEKVLLIGATGTAKTSLIRYLAYLSNNNLVRVNLDAHTDTAEFIGHYVPTEGKKGEFTWQDGILIKALKNGWWILLDEINLADAEILERINSLLDDDACLVITECENEKLISKGEYEKKLVGYTKEFIASGKSGDEAKEHAQERLKQEKVYMINPSFRLFAAMNPEHYTGRNRLSIAMRNKFNEIWLPDKWKKEELEEIVRGYLSKYLPEHFDKDNLQNTAKAMVAIHSKIKELTEIGSLRGRDSTKYEFSIRELRSWAKYIGTFAKTTGIKEAFIQGANYLYADRLEPSKRENIQNGLEQKTMTDREVFSSILKEYC